MTLLSKSSDLSFMIGTKTRRKSGSTLDSNIRVHLEELNALLEKKIWPLAEFEKLEKKARRKKKEEGEEENQEEGSGVALGMEDEFLRQLLTLPLLPRKVLSENPWENESLLGVFNHVDSSEDSLHDSISKDSHLSQLYYDFMDKIEQRKFGLNFNHKTIFAVEGGRFIYEGIVSYLVSYAYYIREIGDVNALVNFINQHENGIQNIIRYVTISAARTIIQQEKLELGEIDDDNNPLFKTLGNSNISFQAGSFKGKALSVIKNYLFSSPYLGWIEQWMTDNPETAIAEHLKPALVQLIKRLNKTSKIQIDEDSFGVFMPSLLSQLMGQSQDGAEDPDEFEADGTSDEDFEVSVFEDDQASTQVNASNVKCAAQLFYAMTLGDELDVFKVVNFLTHKYLIRGGMEIKDRKLREDLQLYVFSNKFIDLRTGRVMERTRPAERHMFYKQVFNYGNAQITDDVIVNDEFTKLWKVLMLESAKYLERAQESPHPLNFVSKQNVMQSVEDLQYNLSSHCTGMVNVITPIIYQELYFVIRRIFMHKEIMNQVVPSGGSWWRVVENLYASMNSRRMKTTVINNKAIQGHDIIRAIAEYTPSTFENDINFSEFISSVDSFITTQSILQESLVSQIRKEETESEEADEPYPKDKIKSSEPVHAGNDEWDF